MLEYACGPGIISLVSATSCSCGCAIYMLTKPFVKTLAPFLTQVVGIDVSENMVAEYNSNASAAGVSQKVIGHQADLIGDEVPQDSADWTDVDLLVVSMALHHFEYPGQALKKLGTRLKKGGVFYIIDLVPQPGHDHGHNHHGHHGHHHHSDGKQDSHGHEKHQHAFGEAAKTVKTHGFSQDDMQQLFQGAGLTDQINYQVLSSPLEFTKDDQTFFKTVFIARAQRQ